MQAIDSDRARALELAPPVDPVAPDHAASLEARTQCPPKPAEPPVHIDGKGKVWLIETDAERLARVEAQISYWTHPDNGEDPEFAYWSAAYWRRFLNELHDRGVRRAA